MDGKEIKRIVMFKGDIETTAYFSMEMEKLFVREGYLTFFYDYQNVGKSSRELLLFLRKGETAVVTFNYHGLCGDSEVIYDGETKEYIWDTFDVPCINIAVDHPFYYHRFFEKLPKRYIHISIDRNHEKYMEEYFPHIERGPFLPLAGTSLYPKGDYKPIKERTMDIVFTGNFVPAQNFNVYIERAGDEYTAFYMGILDELKEHPERLLEDVAKKHILAEIPEATHDEIKETLGNMIFLDMYIRFWFRGEVVRILAESGYKIHVFGHGWEELECSHKENLVIGGSLNSHGCLEKISDAKISLNVMPWFKEGAHDRIFNSMLNGAVCVTDSSNYMDDYLIQNKNALVYTLSHLEELPDMVKKLMQNEKMMQEIADGGYAMAMQDHIWEKRAIKIVDFLRTMN